MTPRIDYRPLLADRFRRPDVAVIDVDQRTARKIAVHYDFEDIVVQIAAREVPVVVVGLIQEVETVQSLHPAYLHLHIQIPGIVVHAFTALRVHQLVSADGVTVGHDGPIVRITVDARDLVWRKLKYLESDVGPRQRGLRRQHRRQKQGANEATGELLHVNPYSIRNRHPHKWRRNVISENYYGFRFS